MFLSMLADLKISFINRFQLPSLLTAHAMLLSTVSPNPSRVTDESPMIISEYSQLILRPEKTSPLLVSSKRFPSPAHRSLFGVCKFFNFRVFCKILSSEKDFFIDCILEAFPIYTPVYTPIYRFSHYMRHLVMKKDRTAPS